MGKVGQFLLGAALIVAGFVFPPAAPFLFSAGTYFISAAIMPGLDLAVKQEGIFFRTASLHNAIAVVYGKAHVGFTPVDIRVDPNSDDDRDLYIVGAVCHASGDGTGIQSIDEIYFNQELAFNALGTIQPWLQIDFGTVTVDYAAVTKYLGTSAQTADATMIAKFPSAWNSNHRGRYIAYVVLKLTFNKEKYSGIPQITAIVKGNKVYDVRDTTWKYSDNPALCIYDYLTSTQYGMGVPAGEIDTQSFIDIANYCDETVSIPNGAGGSTTQKRFTLNGFVDTNRSVQDNLMELMSSCRANLIYQGGKFRLHVRRPTSTSGVVLTEANIIGEWTFTIPGQKERFNIARGSFVNVAQRYMPDSIQWPGPEVSNTYLTADGGYENRLEITMPFTTNAYMAQHILQTWLKESRQAFGVSVTVKEEGLKLQVGDIVQITHTDPGWNAKPFWVMSVFILRDGSVRLGLMEYDSSAYNLDTLNDRPAFPDTNLPNPRTCLAPGALTLSTGTRRPYIRATWVKSNDTFIDGYDVQARLSTEAEFKDMPSATEENLEMLIGPVDDGEIWAVRVRAYNTLGVRSSWSTAQHTVDIIKTARFSVVATGEATAVAYTVTFGEDCELVEVYSIQNDAAAGTIPPEQTEYLAGIMERTIGNNFLRIATTASKYRRTKLVGYAIDGVRGEEYTFDTQATSGAGPSGPPTGLTKNSSTPYTITAGWTNGDASAQTRIYKNGSIIGVAAAGATSYQITGLVPNTTYSIEVDHYKNGTASTKAGPVSMATSLLTLDAPQSFESYGAQCGGAGDPEMAWAWVMGANAAGAKTRIQRSATGAWAGEEVEVLVTADGAETASVTTPTSGSFYHRVRHEKSGWTNSSWTNDPDLATYGACEPA